MLHKATFLLSVLHAFLASTRITASRPGSYNISSMACIAAAAPESWPAALCN